MHEVSSIQSPPPFRAVLTPHRSLGRAGFLILMCAIAGVSFAVGMAFFMIGAWPVLGFFGLDVVLIYWAFKLNYRSGREAETIEVTQAHLTLTRYDPEGRERTFEFNPFWVRVVLDEWPSGKTALRLTSHGKSTPFASFLSDDERREFADVLAAELQLARGA